MFFEIVEKKKVMINRSFFSCEITPAVYASVKLENGTMLEVSRYIDETEWAVDSIFNKNGFPVHSNGTGSRAVRYRTIADVGLKNSLDEIFESLMLK